MVEEDLLTDRGHPDMFSGKEEDAYAVTIATYVVSLVMCIWALRKHKKALNK